MLVLRVIVNSDLVNVIKKDPGHLEECNLILKQQFSLKRYNYGWEGFSQIRHSYLSVR